MISQAPRGAQDWYGEDMLKRAIVEKIARDIAKTYHMGEISTPMFEHTVLFQRGVGETTDVVQKEMYTFEDKGGRSITLKPEGTSPAVRAFIEHKQYAEVQPTKIQYITPCYRYEKPQSGRLREFHQFGIEVFGTPNMMADAEVISLGYVFLTSLGITEIVQRKENIIFYGDKFGDIDMMKFLKETPYKIGINSTNKPFISSAIPQSKQPLQVMNDVLNILRECKIEE